MNSDLQSIEFPLEHPQRDTKLQNGTLSKVYCGKVG